MPAPWLGKGRAQIFLALKQSTLASATARASVVNAITAFVIRDALAEEEYCAQLAGIFYRYIFNIKIIKQNKIILQIF
jgi:hypothetical protein